jgi:hypothetical protein
MTQANKSLPVHPGTIVFVDADSSSERVSVASSVPELARFAPNAQGELTPIVRVVARRAGDKRIIQEFGPSGEMLRSTVQVRS